MADMYWRFNMFKSGDHYSANFVEPHGAYHIYTLLRLTVQDSEFPRITYAGTKENRLTLVGEDGKAQWLKHIMPYVHKQDKNNFFFLVSRGELVRNA